jgi:hypothetical protein
MSATITWVIEWMQASTAVINGHSEVVLTAGWRCNGTETAGTPEVTYNATNYGSTTFPQPAEGGTFTPYASLTQEQVLGWCWANGVDKTATEASVQASINNKINPPITTPPLPWNPTTPTA